jgi:hypothetical protein
MVITLISIIQLPLEKLPKMWDQSFLRMENFQEDGNPGDLSF